MVRLLAHAWLCFFVGTCFKYIDRKHSFVWKKSQCDITIIFCYNTTHLASEHSQVLLYVDINKHFNKCLLICKELYLFCCHYFTHPLNSMTFSEDTDSVKQVLQNAESLICNDLKAVFCMYSCCASIGWSNSKPSVTA